VLKDRKHHHVQPTARKKASPNSQAVPKIRSGSRWLFRVAAMTVIPVLFLLITEGVLRLAQYGYSTQFFRTLSVQGKKMVVENDRFSWRFFPRQLVRRPLPVSFSAEKAAGTYRVFVMGESAAMGDPEPAFSFSRILEVLLRERYPGAHFEVINVAFTAINSHVILPIARACAEHQGDLWVIYMGHNEFQGPFGPGTVFGSHRSRLWLVRASLALKTTRLGQLFEAWQARLRGQDASHPTWQGLEMFQQNQIRPEDPRLQSMYDQFRQNLDDILKVAHKAGTPVLLCTPGCNLKDSAPFASLHPATLGAERLADWEGHYGQAVAAEKAGDHPKALDSLQAAKAIDGDYADLQFRMGDCYLGLHQPDAARQSFQAACDLDALRFRADSHLNLIIEQAARQAAPRGVELCGTRQALSTNAAGGIPGDDLFFDHVHLTFQGNYVIAKAIADEVKDRVPALLRKSDTGAWADAATCSKRLGLSDWSQYQMYQAMNRRLLEAPFTNQLNQTARRRFYADKLSELRPALRPDGLQAAVQLCRDALERSPNDPMLHDNLGQLLAALGDDSGAVAQFTRVTEIWPHHPTAFNNVGLLLQKQGKDVEAERYFRLALARQPDFADAYNGLGLIQAARGDLDGAIASYRQALADNPELVEAQSNLGQALHKQGKLDEAVAAFTETLRLRSTFVPAQFGLAEVLLQQGKMFDAIPYLAQAAKLQPEGALSRVNKAVQFEPENPKLLFERANVLAALHRSDEAVECLKTAVRIKPDFWEARYLLGVELASRDKIEEAQDQFAAVVHLEPSYARAHLNLGVALARQLRLSDAAEQFRIALRLEPTNQLAMQFLRRLQGAPAVR
jgi:tetratricopeptide (TPR) repeat protein